MTEHLLDRRVCRWVFTTMVLLLSMTTVLGCEKGLQVIHHAHPRADIITVTVPPTVPVKLAVAPTLKTVTQFASPADYAVLNAGFFDPSNSMTTSWLISGDKTVGNPTLNPTLVNNHWLKPYLPAILTQRPELRAYQCAAGVTYAIVPHGSPLSCKLLWAVGAGPTLLPNYTPFTEAFIDSDPVTGNRTRDPVGVDEPNARSAVALLPGNRLMLVYVGQTPDGKKGLSLPDLAAWLKQQGAVSAMALDGGSSTSMVLDNKTYWGKGRLNDKGWQPYQRSVKSVLVVSTPDKLLNKCK